MHEAISICVYILCIRALLMSPSATCDLGKGKVSVLMRQLMHFPPLQMALIGHGMAHGQMLGVTATSGEAREDWRWFLCYCVCFVCSKNANCLLTFSSVSFIESSYTQHRG